MMINEARVARDVVVVAASAGGVQALSKLCAQLSPRIPAGVAIAYHRSPSANGYIHAILQRVSAMPICEPQIETPFAHGTIFLAPRDHHLLFNHGSFMLNRGPQLHHVRPAADPLFTSAAAMYGPRVVGVVLSGCGFDGAGGSLAIKQAGGLVLVQSPDDAEFPFMPRAAIQRDDVDAVLPVSALVSALAALAAGEAITV